MKIMIDPGHYGSYVNQSPVDKTYYESATVWVLAGYIAEELRKLGALVGMTRTNIDQDKPLVERGTDAAGYDLFISIHTNAAGTSGPNWPVCFTQVSGASDDIGKRIGKALQPLFGADRYEAYSRPADYDAGQDWYGVLRGASRVGVPGVIVEHGFHTNEGNVSLLKQDSFLRKLAKTEAKAIYDYLKEQEVQTVVKPPSYMLYGRVKGLDPGDVLNVRIGPGVTFDILKAYSALGEGNQIDIVGRDDTQKWLYIRIADRYFGWVNRSYIEVI